MKKLGLMIVVATLLLGITMAVVPVSSAVIPHGLKGRYWQDSFFGLIDLPYPICVDIPLPLGGPYPTPDIERVDLVINFHIDDWQWREFGAGHCFSVKWTGIILIPSAGTYEFRLASDDGSWLFIDKALIINRGNRQAPGTSDGSIYLDAGSHEIVIDYYETCDTQCGMGFLWKPPGANDWVIVPSDVLGALILPNPVPEFGLELPLVISLAAPALSIVKRRRLKIIK